jgi:hypothetical protein
MPNCSLRTATSITLELSESSHDHREARPLIQCSKHPVTAVFLSHWIAVQAFQYKRLPLLDTCSRYVHTRTAWHVQSVCPHKHCLTRAVGMSTQELLDTCSRYVHTSTAWHVQSVCPHSHVKPLHYLRSLFRCNVSECETSSSVTKCRYSVSNVAVSPSCCLMTELTDCPRNERTARTELLSVVWRWRWVVLRTVQSVSFMNGKMWGIGLFWLAVTGCKFNLVCVLDGALEEVSAVHRLTGSVCGCQYAKWLMNDGEWLVRTTSKHERRLCPGASLPHIMCLVWLAETPWSYGYQWHHKVVVMVTMWF